MLSMYINKRLALQKLEEIFQFFEMSHLGQVRHVEPAVTSQQAEKSLLYVKNREFFTINIASLRLFLKKIVEYVSRIDNALTQFRC